MGKNQRNEPATQPAEGPYYARVKVNGKQKWRGHWDDRLFRCKTSARRPRKAARAQGLAARGESEAGDGNESNDGRFATIDRPRTEHNASLSAGTKLRRKIAVTAVLRTWPDFPKRDVPHLTPPNGQAWDAKALREGRASSHPLQRPIQPPACWGPSATGRFTVH
jgi:hypothetical protein